MRAYPVEAMVMHSVQTLTLILAIPTDTPCCWLAEENSPSGALLQTESAYDSVGYFILPPVSSPPHLMLAAC